MTRKEKRFFDKELNKLAHEVIDICIACRKEGVKTSVFEANTVFKSWAKIEIGNLLLRINVKDSYYLYYKDVCFEDYENMANVLRIVWNIFSKEKERLLPLLNTHKNNRMREFEAEFSAYLTRN
jgi:hypothetical protein